MPAIALKHDAPVPTGLKTGSKVELRGKVQTDPVKVETFQIPRGAVLSGEVIASEHDDLGHQRLKIKVEGKPGKAYYWVYNGKVFNQDPFEKVLSPTREHAVSKRQILEHYRMAWPALRKECIGHQLTVVLFWSGSLKQTRLWPFSGKRTFEITSWHDLERIIYYHGIEIIPDLELKTEPGKLRRCVIDVDSKASLDDTKHVVVLLYRRLLELGYKPYIVSTGSKAGFHVRFDLDKPQLAMKIKARVEKDVLLHLWATSDVIRDVCLDPHRRMYPKDPAIRSGKVFLDLSPMKSRGGIKAIGSINAKTFGIVQRVPLNQLATFVPRLDAM